MISKNGKIFKKKILWLLEKLEINISLLIQIMTLLNKIRKIKFTKKKFYIKKIKYKRQFKGQLT